MTVELIFLVASVLVSFVLGLPVGYALGARRHAARASRQKAAQLSIYRQLHELQTSRKKSYPSRARAGAFS